MEQDVPCNVDPCPVDCEMADWMDDGSSTGLKGSIDEGPNHSNFSHQSSGKILSKFKNFS